MEYTNGQRVEIANGEDEWRPATYIGKDWTVFGQPYDAHVVLPLNARHGTAYEVVDNEDIRRVLTREERIERAIEDYACMVYGGDSDVLLPNSAAVLYAILDAEIPE